MAAQNNMLPQQQMPAEVGAVNVIELPPDAFRPVDAGVPADDMTSGYYEVPMQPDQNAAGDYGQYYTNPEQQRTAPEPIYQESQIQEFPSAEDEYDEYGYNAQGESNYKGEAPPANTNIYYQ